MSVPSFALTVVPALISALEGNAALNAFASANWGRTFAGRVRYSYRKRTEFASSELPQILITRPTVRKSLLSTVKDGRHTVLVYFLFHQDDREQGPLQLLQLEELIDDALLGDCTLGGAATSTTPEEAANDEGKNHPVYAGVGSYIIEHRRMP